MANNLLENAYAQASTTINKSRTVFPYKKSWKCALEVGRLTPIGGINEVLPGDTWSMNIAGVVRSMTLIAPIMDNIYIDICAFFVPNRVVWEHWNQFCGENDTSAWTQNSSYTVPTHNYTGASGETYATFALKIGANYGLPFIDTTDTYGITELPLRGYYQIYNDWFRNENVIAPVVFLKGDNANTVITYHDNLLKVAKLPDWVTKMLPSPQKGSAGQALLFTNKGFAPVYTVGGVNAPTVPSHTFYPLTFEKAASGSGLAEAYSAGSGVIRTLGIANTDLRPTSTYTGAPQDAVAPANLFADLTNSINMTINNLRYSIMLQRYYETAARGGTRYVEVLNSFFGISNSDARLDRSELLCQKRFNVHVSQVVSTSDTTNGKVGDTGGMIAANFKDSLFTKTYTEHGYNHFFALIRTENSYSQGLERQWKHLNKFDFYWPSFDHIGEQPVMSYEINAKSANQTFVAGYQEAWFEYRFQNSRSVAYLDPSITGSLNYWDLQEVLGSTPYLNKNLIEQQSSPFSRVLTINNSYQFICDFYLFGKVARIMSPDSEPGLIGRL